MEWLLNWVVQGSGLTLIVAAGVGGMRRLNAATRERIWWVTLAAVIATPAARWLWTTAGAAPVWAAFAGPDPFVAVPPWPTSVLIVTAVWGSGTAVRLARLARDLLRVAVAKGRAIPFPPDRESRLVRWAHLRGHGRAARLVLSRSVHHAAVLGFRNPVIALAPATVARLSDRELDQIVTHEHAHVRRRDDVAALVQHVISAMLWWHPAVWWLDRALTIEREVACDDWVVADRDGPGSYGACLVKLASMSRERRTALAPALLVSRSELEIRITRLIDRGRRVSIQPSWAALSVATPGVVCLALACTAVAVFGPSAIVLPAISRPEPRILALDRLLAPPSLGAQAPTTGSAATAPRSRVAPERMSQAGTRTVSRIDRAAQVDAPAQVLRDDDHGLTGEPPPLGVEEAASVLPAAALPARLSMPPAAKPVPAPHAADPVAAGISDSPWSVFGAGGTAAGRRAQDAAVSTARFFSQFGKSIGTAFRPGSAGRRAEP